MNDLQAVSEETMRFMRGKYALDEVQGKYYDVDCLKFRQGRKTILSINIYEDRYDFQIIFGKNERDIFELRRSEFSQYLQDIYDNSNTFHDGKWMMFPVDNLDSLEAIKPLIMIKKKPNRKPFPKDKAVYSDCGHRCDLCVHYISGSIDEELQSEMKERVRRVYDLDPDEKFPPCKGCANGGITGKYDCDQRKCAKVRGVPRCLDCPEYDCGLATVGLKPLIEARSISAADVTWAILPYVEGQYGN